MVIMKMTTGDEADLVTGSAVTSETTEGDTTTNTTQYNTSTGVKTVETKTKSDKDTTWDFLDDTVKIGSNKIKYKYIIGGVLLMVLLVKK